VRIVVDTNVFVSACLAGGAPNEVIARCLAGEFQPLMGNSLFSEYEAVLARTGLFAKSRLNANEREFLLDVFLATCQWTRIYYQWRPNLRDETDNHLIELAIAGGAQYLISGNLRDLRTGQLKFPQLQVLTPADFLKRISR
jgi:putative PIN family toxin of toxin-antitoxin system